MHVQAYAECKFSVLLLLLLLLLLRLLLLLLPPHGRAWQ